MADKEQFKELLNGIEKEIEELKRSRNEIEDSDTRISELKKEAEKIREDLDKS